MIPADSPADSAMVKKVLLISLRWGRPKEMFETPNTVRPPIWRMARTASNVIWAECWSVLMVMVSGSMTMSLRAMP